MSYVKPMRHSGAIIDLSFNRHTFWRMMRTKLWSQLHCRKSSTTCWSLTQILLRRWGPPSLFSFFTSLFWVYQLQWVFRGGRNVSFISSVGFSLSSALLKLLEQHESAGHLPLRPQSLALFWPPHLVWKWGKEQRGWGIWTKSALCCT